MMKIVVINGADERVNVCMCVMAKYFFVRAGKAAMIIESMGINEQVVVFVDMRFSSLALQICWRKRIAECI